MKTKLSDAILSIVHAFPDEGRKDWIRVMAKKVKMLEDELESTARYWDCDEDGHKYNTGCRCCDAKQILEDSQMTEEDYGL